MNAQKTTILVVEDDPSTVVTIRHMLEGLGYRVLVSASCGEKALRLTEETKPDLVLMNIHLAGEMDGIETATQIRDRFDVPHILLNAHTDDTTLGQAKTTHPLGYTFKPFDARTLKTTIEMALGRVEDNPSVDLLIGAVSQAASAVMITDAELDEPGPRILFVNQAFEEMTGYTKDEVIGQTPRILQGPRTDRDVLNRLREDLSTGRPFFGNAVNYRKDGTEFDLEWHIFPIRNAQSKATYFVAVQRDISGQREEGITLLQSEERFRKSFEMSPAYTYLVSTEGRILDVNAAAVSTLGYTREELIGMDIRKLYVPDVLPAAMQCFERLKKDGMLRNEDLAIFTKGGERREVRLSSSVVYDEDKRFLYTLSVQNDVTDLKRAEDKVRSSRRIIHDLYRIAAQHGQRLEDQLGDILSLGCAYLKLEIGILARIEESTYTVKAVQGEDLPISPGDTFDVGDTFCRVAFLSDEPVGSSYVGKSKFSSHPAYAKLGMEAYLGVSIRVDGKRYGTLNFSSPNPHTEEFSEDDYGVMRLMGEWIGSQIELERAHEQLHNTLTSRETSFQTICDSARDAIVMINEDASTTFWNPAAEKMFGFSKEEVIGNPLHHFIASPEDHEKANQGWSKFREEGTGFVIGRLREVAGLRKDGSVFPAELSVNALKLSGQWHAVGLIRDITERKEAEEELQKAFSEIQHLKNQLEMENVYLQQEIDEAGPHHEMIGTSPAVHDMLHQAKQVASTDSSVLVLGETGTGKELLARTIHAQSPRKSRAMVALNCAAMPASLVESELFGREKGAYTGALSQQAGRFEVADGSTLFLDEVGELPMEVQAKLLRVLQEGSFERLGSSKTVQVNVRIIAATNRNLEKAIEEGIFREDLYYRLNIFPIRVPALRERSEDLPSLVWTFVKEFGERMGKSVETISQGDMDALQRYDWPGNIRELRNFIERAMILCQGSHLKVRLAESPNSRERTGRTLDDVQRDHILEVLESVDWKIRGPRGAAEILGMKPTTLESRMTKLGLRRK